MKSSILVVEADMTVLLFWVALELHWVEQLECTMWEAGQVKELV